jgi:hypothetical protein
LLMNFNVERLVDGVSRLVLPGYGDKQKSSISRPSRDVVGCHRDGSVRDVLKKLASPRL